MTEAGGLRVLLGDVVELVRHSDTVQALAEASERLHSRAAERRHRLELLGHRVASMTGDVSVPREYDTLRRQAERELAIQEGAARLLQAFARGIAADHGAGDG